MKHLLIIALLVLSTWVIDKYYAELSLITYFLTVAYLFYLIIDKVTKNLNN